MLGFLQDPEGAAVDLMRALATVSPTLDADVLSVLARHRTTFTTGQLRRVLDRGSEEGIRRVLRRLTAQGIVLAERVGPAYAYRLNHEHLAAPHITRLADLFSTLLERLEAELAGWSPPPVYAAVFGSTVRRTATSESDLDLFLVRPDRSAEDDWDAQVTALTSEATRWTGNDTRALQYTERELDLAVEQGDAVLREVARDALTIAGSRSWFDGRVRGLAAGVAG